MITMNSPEPPKLKLCWHVLCNWHRILCFLGIHKLAKMPYAMGIEKYDEQLMLVENFCCMCTKRVQVRKRSMVNMLGMMGIHHMEIGDDDSDEDHLFTVH